MFQIFSKGPIVIEVQYVEHLLNFGFAWIHPSEQGFNAPQVGGVYPEQEHFLLL